MSFLSARYLDLVAERRRGLVPDLLRAFLSVLSVPYAAIIILRNLYYDAYRRAAQRPPCPVISIGNLTVGGTGKTPVSAAIAGRLIDRGRHVAILLRGYKDRAVEPIDRTTDFRSRRGRSPGDEALVLKRRCPRAIVLADPDRVASADRALREGADVLVLDDGFQHRRMARDLDVVLVDATKPFGHGHILPRGLLREPASSLRRAHLIVVTRSDEVEQAARTLLLGTLRRVSGNKPIIEAVHRAGGFLDLKGRAIAIDDPTAVRAVIFAGIANFESFRRGVERMGVQVAAAYQYPDHHPFSTEEIQGLIDVSQTLEANAVITTEKDAVKLVGRWNERACRLLVVDLRIEFDEQGDKILNEAIDAALAK